MTTGLMQLSKPVLAMPGTPEMHGPESQEIPFEIQYFPSLVETECNKAINNSRLPQSFGTVP